MTKPPPPQRAGFKKQITLEAQRLGFEAIGFARADQPLDQDFAHYEAFLNDNKQGEMTWLANFREARQRVDSDHILPGAKTVICLARRYARPESEEANDPDLAKRIARYARGRDYHNGMRKKLRKLAAFIRRLGNSEIGAGEVEDGEVEPGEVRQEPTKSEPPRHRGTTSAAASRARGESTSSESDPPASSPAIQARPLCDEEPILERAWAARAGLGFVGKNGLLIVPGVGSMVLLGEVVTTLEIEPEPIIPERCGSCTRCLDVCPTQAFDAPFVLDPRRCVSYLTIEHRGAIDVSLRDGIGEHLFGCDDCQTVCPFNASRGRRASSEVDLRFEPDERWVSTSLIDLLAIDDEGFVKLREGSPIGRATRAGLARNAAIVLGSSAAAIDDDQRRALEHAACSHDSAIVREAAGWALQKKTGG